MGLKISLTYTLQYSQSRQQQQKEKKNKKKKKKFLTTDHMPETNVEGK
jgi:hypothetical protein